MNVLKEFWYSRDSWERAMISFGLIALALILIWALVLDPIDKKLNLLRTQVPAKEESLRYMLTQQQNLEMLRDNDSTFEVDRSIPILTVIE